MSDDHQLYGGPGKEHKVEKRTPGVLIPELPLASHNLELVS